MVQIFWQTLLLQGSGLKSYFLRFVCRACLCLSVCLSLPGCLKPCDHSGQTLQITVSLRVKLKSDSFGMSSRNVMSYFQLIPAVNGG